MLHIYLFGRVRIYCETGCATGVPHDRDDFEADEVSSVKLGHFAQGLIAYLALNRHRLHSRDSLSELFWGDQLTEQAKACLSTALWRLRRVLEPAGVLRGTYLLADGTGDVSLNQTRVSLDVTEFEDSLQYLLAKPIHELSQPEIDRAEHAINQCAGELMEDFFDDWVVAERERLRCLRLNGMVRLMTYFRAHGLAERAITQAQSILREDPLREDIHRELMRLYLDAGQRAMAGRQYEVCKAVLQRELGIRPMPETQQVMAQLSEDSPRTFGKASSKTRLDEALAAVHVAQKQLQQATYFLGLVASQSE